MSSEIETVKANLPNEYAQQLADTYIHRIRELAQCEAFDLDVGGKTIRFRRRKILNRERVLLEMLRQKLAAAAAKNDPSFPSLEDELYKKSAAFFLVDIQTGQAMTEKQYDEVAFEDLKPVLDALNFRTERPIPIPAPLENPKT